MPTKSFNYLIVGVMIAFCVCFSTPGFSRGSFGGGGRSFGGGSYGGGSHSYGGGSSWGGAHTSTPTRSTGWGSSTRTPTPSTTPRSGFGSGASNSSGWGSGRRPTSTTSPSLSGNRPITNNRPTSAADTALYQKARMNHTAFTDRTSAVTNFKQRYGNQYTSHFTSEPRVRPAYIPQSYAVGGRHVTIIYNQGYGGYGYWHPFTHAWMMYDMWQDQMMMNHMMMMNGYYYGAAPGYGYGGYPPVVHHYYTGSILSFLFWLVVIIVIIYLIFRWTRRQEDSTRVIEYDEPAVGITSSPIFTSSTPAVNAGAPVVTAAPAAFSTGPHRADYAHEGGKVFDNEDANTAFWRNLPLGSVVSLSDPQALADSEKEGRGGIARDCTVEEIRTIDEMNGLATWKLFRLYEVKQELWLMAKLVDDNIDLRIYYQVPDDEFKPGNRRDMIDHGVLWLFQQPANPDHFNYNELEYTTEIEGPSEPGQPPLKFEMKDQGEIHGTMLTTTTQKPIGERCFVTLVEYAANRDCENPELLILEMGGVSPDANAPDSDEGGLIVLLQGTPITADEIEVLQGKKH